MKTPTLEIQSASVKVMRSHDYCHFEVCLSAAVVIGPDAKELTPEAVDDLRKCAARLADKAVEQYKEAKEHREFKESYTAEHAEQALEELGPIPESELTTEQNVRLKDAKDVLWRAGKEYDYQDTWQDDD